MPRKPPSSWLSRRASSKRWRIRSPKKNRAHEERQLACFEIEQQLVEARQRLAGLNVDAERTRGKLASQAKESGAIEERISQAENETQNLSSASPR